MYFTDDKTLVLFMKYHSARLNLDEQCPGEKWKLVQTDETHVSFMSDSGSKQEIGIDCIL